MARENFITLSRHESSISCILKDFVDSILQIVFTGFVDTILTEFPIFRVS
jgi:hypothetical protein